MIVRLNQWILAACCLTLLSNTALAGKPGGGGNPPPPPPLPNVRYQVDVIPTTGTSVWVNQINNNGVVVGHVASQAFIYQIGGRYYDMNVDTDLQPVRDQLNDVFGPDWFFNSAVGINDIGQVVGRVQNALTGVTKGYALDTSNLAVPENWILLSLPEIASNSSYGKRINLSGQVLGTYVRADNTVDGFLCNPWTSSNAITPLGINLFQGNIELNNFGHVAGVLSNNIAFFDSNPSPGLPSMQTFSSLSGCLQLGGVNDFGVFSVNGREMTGTKGNKWGPLATFRVANQQERIMDAVYPYGINFDGDVAMYASGPSYLAYNGSLTVAKQVFKVTDLVPTGPMKDLLENNAFNVQALNDRDGTGFSQLTGRVFTSQGTIGVVLTPYTP